MTIQATSLTVTRAGRTILDGVSLSVTAGTCLMLRGPNGIGKTTLLKTLAGLLPVTGGSLEIDRDQVAYSGHLDGVKAQMTVAENLTFWADVYGTGNVSAVLDRLDLTALSDRLAHNLSAGQKRRLGLGRMLLTGRSIWIMDEPTSSLDTKNTALFSALIADHCVAGGIAIVSTHLDLDVEGAQTLDLSRFAATTSTAQSDPFLDGAFT